MSASISELELLTLINTLEVEGPNKPLIVGFSLVNAGISVITGISGLFAKPRIVTADIFTVDGTALPALSEIRPI